MPMSLEYTLSVTCNECGYVGSLEAIRLHSCAIAAQGGRCEDYPACGHTDGDGCQTFPQHTADYWHDHRRAVMHDSVYGTGDYACEECGYGHDTQALADECADECGGELPEPYDPWDDPQW